MNAKNYFIADKIKVRIYMNKFYRQPQSRLMTKKLNYKCSPRDYLVNGDYNAYITDLRQSEIKYYKNRLQMKELTMVKTLFSVLEDKYVMNTKYYYIANKMKVRIQMNKFYRQPQTRLVMRKLYYRCKTRDCLVDRDYRWMYYRCTLDKYQILQGQTKDERTNNGQLLSSVLERKYIGNADPTSSI